MNWPHCVLQTSAKNFKGRKLHEDNCPQPSRGDIHFPPRSALAESIKIQRENLKEHRGSQRSQRLICTGDLPLAFARKAHRTNPCQLRCRLGHRSPPGRSVGWQHKKHCLDLLGISCGLVKPIKIYITISITIIIIIQKQQQDKIPKLIHYKMTASHPENVGLIRIRLSTSLSRVCLTYPQMVGTVLKQSWTLLNH